MATTQAHLALAAVLALALSPSSASAWCWADAERESGVSADLLYAVATQESSLRPDAMNMSHVARTKSYGIGLMQIDSRHLPRLAAKGISDKDLLEPCTSIKVGASILAESFARLGVNWNAVGAYNAGCAQLKGEACTAARMRYAWSVYRHLPRANAALNRSRAAGSSTARSDQTPRRLVANAQAAQPLTYILSARVTP